jgi:hypothetical protein
MEKRLINMVVSESWPSSSFFRLLASSIAGGWIVFIFYQQNIKKEKNKYVEN